MLGASANVLHRYWYQRCSYVSVIAMIGDGPLKMSQTTLTFGAVVQYSTVQYSRKKSPKLIQIPQTIFNPTLGNNYWLEMTKTGFAG
jgi:hypothetical protein